MIHCRVQAHPSRALLHQRLRTLLDPLPVEVMLHSSDPPDPWSNYKRCLEYGGEASHLLILQDDAIPTTGFVPAIQSIADRWPDTPVCLFMGALPSSTAVHIRRAKPDVRYVPLTVGSFMPLVAVLWPVRKAREFLEWSLTARPITRADDGNAGKWVRRTKQQVMVAVPSIVQHDDEAPSVKGGRDHKPWAESWRRALFLADDCSKFRW